MFLKLLQQPVVVVPEIPPTTAAAMVMVVVAIAVVVVATGVAIAVVVVAMAVVEIIAPICLAPEAAHIQNLVLIVDVIHEWICRLACPWFELAMRGRFKQLLLDMGW